MDPYVYKGTSVLINLLDITDENELINVEAQLLIAGILEMDTLLEQVDFMNYEAVSSVHRFLFGELYSWSGEYRTIDIYKNEPVLNGLSISYSAASEIKRDVHVLFEWIKDIEWRMDNPDLPNAFINFIVRLWRIHPFREGNTRTVSIYIKLFAEKQGIYFNLELISRHSNYFRNALVLATIEEAPDFQYLNKIVKEALTPVFLFEHQATAPSTDKYKQINGYNVSNYEERPFYTDEDVHEGEQK